MAQSVEKINTAIIAKLREFPSGLPVDQLGKSIKSASKKDIQTRLYDLQNKGEVERLPGNKWRVTVKAEVPAPVAPAATNGSTKAAAPVNTHPTVNVPGMPKWTSYKNSLIEYCQKLKFDPPKYASEKVENSGFFSTVTFGSTQLKSTQGRPSAKLSDQQASFEALIALEYLPRGATFQEAAKPEIGQKRKQPPTNMADMISCPPSKMTVDEAHMFKSRLNELAQRNKLPAPVWETVSTAGGFFSTVLFNGRQFKSSQCLPKKKQSEQNASHMALYLLQQVVDPPQGYNDQMAVEAPPGGDAIENMIREARAITTSHKSKLHEHAQRMKFTEHQLPKYQTTMAEDKSCLSLLTVDGVNFQSDVSKSKKLAEQSAALKALVALGIEGVTQMEA